MADMKSYMLLLGGTGEGVANMPQEAQDAHMDQWRTWFDKLGQEGVLLGGAPFSSESLLVKGKEKAVQSGHFAGSKELAFGGYIIIQADSEEAALNITKQCPTFELDGTIEVREITEM